MVVSRKVTKTFTALGTYTVSEPVSYVVECHYYCGYRHSCTSVQGAANGAAAASTGNGSAAATESDIQ